MSRRARVTTMLFEEPGIREQLARIVRRISWQASWEEDLLQEALIHLWQVEEREPKHSLSWYLQSCQFRLQHYIATGRSVDSWKRGHQRVPLPLPDKEHEPPQEHRWVEYCDSTAKSDANAEEMLCLLSKHLPPLHQRILVHFYDGLSSRAIGDRLGLSHKTVLSLRRQIATVALKLGITPDDADSAGTGQRR